MDTTAPDERYRKYIDKLRAAGENVTTRTKAFYKDLFFVRERRENGGIELPSDVLEGRRANDTLHRIEKHVQHIEEQVGRQKSRGRGLWNALMHGIGVFKSEGDKLFKE